VEADDNARQLQHPLERGYTAENHAHPSDEYQRPDTE
jgi:hypothetical protein